jgi:hypothetical protein
LCQAYSFKKLAKSFNAVECRDMSFKKVAARIAAKEGISVKRAAGMLAASTRRSSAAARRANPALNRVRGGRQ